MSRAVKKTRLAILLRINDLEKQLCATCTQASGNHAVILCDCKAAVEIRRMGNLLNDLTRNVKEEQIRTLVKKVKAVGLNETLYRQLKEFEVPERKIQQWSSMTQKEYYAWKHEKSLISRTKTSEETEDLIRIAAEKGISRKMFWRRHHSDKYTLWEAAHIPSGVPRKDFYAKEGVTS